MDFQTKILMFAIAIVITMSTISVIAYSCFVSRTVIESVIYK